MIDIYLNDSSLKALDKITECISYYESKNLSYNKLYEEYDKINNLKLKREFYKENIFFKNDNLRKINSIFMKECLLESLKRVIENKTNNEINIKDSELNTDINNYKSDFNYYPDIYETDISKKLLSKEELNRHIIPIETGNLNDKCNTKFFELSPHQLFLKNLLSPNTQYKGLLIFHGVGVGKTCSGISIAENFKDVYAEKENRIIILASQNIQIGWRKTIFDPNKGDNQCTGDEYFNDEDDEHQKILNDKQTKKKIKKYYELHGYAAFANSVKKLLKNNTNHIQDKIEKHKAEIKLIKENFSNRILIVDEVHNIRTGESQKQVRDTIHYIEMVIKHSDNLRLVLLTANPMYNLSSEIVWILNMLLMNDNHTTLLENEIFDKDGNLINETLLKNKCQGYISYLRGENPISFPVRLYPRHNPENIIKAPGFTKDIFKNDIIVDKRLSFLELYSSKLQDKQLKIYKNEIDKYEGLEKLKIDNETVLLQISNIVYPNTEDDIDLIYGNNGLLNCMNETTKHNSIQYSYKKETIDNFGEFFHKDIIGNYSAKIKSILEIINNSEGIVFIYSNWIKSGVIPLILALEQNGFTKYDGKKILNTKNKIDLVSYEGKYISEYRDKNDFIPGKYMVITGSTTGLTNHLEQELKIVTGDENKDGKQIKVIIGSTVASEGLDFKNIRSIHVLEPWHNINKIEQVIGRGIRNCSHKTLDLKERNTTIYLHTSLIDDYETIDMYLYRYSEYKSKQIGNIENILKKSAIDKYFFKNANILTEKDIGNFKVEPAYIYEDGNTKIFTVKGGDKKYSRVCSFSPVCDYMKDDKKPIVKTDKDTFQIQYSKGVIDIYKKRIHNLYLKSVSYSLDEIFTILSEYNEIHLDFLYHALREMIYEKYTLHNQNGDQGYLNYNDNYYSFQPYFNEDKLLPIYYRLNKGNIKKIDYIIDPKIKRKSEIITEKQSFNEEVILNTYKKLKEFKFFDYENVILDYLDLNNINFIKISYAFDRLSFEDKLIVCYTVLLYLKEGESYEEMEFMDILVLICERLFIYYDNEFKYFDKFKDANREKCTGIFLFHNMNKTPIFYYYNNREIEIYNKVDEIDIVRMIKKNQNNKIFQFNESWGFTTYSDRIKLTDPFNNNHKGIVLKVIKKTDKLRKNYVYPPGPGLIVQDQSTGAWTGDRPVQFINDELSIFLDKMKPIDKDKLIKSNTKKYYVFFIELCLRMNKNFLQNDLIFMKYY